MAHRYAVLALAVGRRFSVIGLPVVISLSILALLIRPGIRWMFRVLHCHHAKLGPSCIWFFCHPPIWVDQCVYQLLCDAFPEEAEVVIGTKLASYVEGDGSEQPI